MTFVEIRITSHQIRSPALAERAAKAPPKPGWLRYIVLNADEEIAFVALDTYAGEDFVFLYEIFVVEGMRRRGLGTELMKEIEELVWSKGYSRLRLMPTQISGNISKDDLEGWYTRLGYTSETTRPNVFEKLLYPPTQAM